VLKGLKVPKEDKVFKVLKGRLLVPKGLKVPKEVKEPKGLKEV
jgi:hypothetical protein